MRIVASWRVFHHPSRCAFDKPEVAERGAVGYHPTLMGCSYDLMSKLNGDVCIMDDEFFGRMTDPSAGAWVTGPCGDTVEFYLVLAQEVIEQARYYTDGCEFTRLCARAVARHVQGKTIHDALAISAKQILDEVIALPQENRHCAVLAVSAFYKTIGQFWVQQARS